MTTFLLLVSYNVAIAKDDSEVAAIHKLNEYFLPINFTLCLTIGYSLYFCAMSMFSWTTLLCWDLLRSFYHLKPLKTSKGCSGKLVNVLSFMVTLKG
jgi:hypothetical protein